MALTSPGAIEDLAISSVSSDFAPNGVWVAARHAWALVSLSAGASETGARAETVDGTRDGAGSVTTGVVTGTEMAAFNAAPVLA